ncbi:hypothetical protein [Hydrocarboniphaga sp.]|nr:hypothetical protein [Hydrocarboniphaga sp.]
MPTYDYRDQQIAAVPADASRMPLEVRHSVLQPVSRACTPTGVAISV